MTVPARPVHGRDRDRRFDLRTTALFFVLVAIALSGTVFLVRAVAHMAESSPLWVGSLVVVGVGATCLGRSRWRRFSAARCARRAAEVLEEAAERAAASLDTVADDRTVLDGTAVDGDWLDGYGPDSHDVDSGDVDSGDIDTHGVDSDGFERAVADLCVRDACQEVEVVGGAGDLGADVLAVAPDGRRIVIQCKLYGEDNKVGSQDLQRFGGTCFTVHGADVAALVTTSDFTAPALAYAQTCGIVCIDGTELQAWSDGTGPSPWELVATEPDASGENHYGSGEVGDWS
ncbi:restriction endonuclease [Streptomyces sp. p1417]|uniref:Restriction endonuclease n=1 Tax=Streptomyces typhae TaxID=2681492 RepID=A0A6L6WX79_9ACTN|nr:restriction endonuclease [Streptomyces typhae]MVO85401.1 restriction endonuclease [Streptomyces typhae]